MNQESVVYGCIKDMLMASDPGEAEGHRERNREVMQALPSIEEWPLLSREMFSLPVEVTALDDWQTDVIHFGSAYKAVEYEWQTWLDQFEAMLKQMYWVSATVHLETEFNGTHTFSWEPEESFHEPSSGDLAVRCEWSREASVF